MLLTGYGDAHGKNISIIDGGDASRNEVVDVGRKAEGRGDRERRGEWRRGRERREKKRSTYPPLSVSNASTHSATINYHHILAHQRNGQSFC